MSVPRSDGTPEQRWRRTLDLRKRPATLKVSRLLQDFGYTELSPSVASAIETRLAKVSLMVEPSLAIANLGDVISITRGLREAERAPRAAQTSPPDDRPARSDTDPGTHESPVDAGATERITALERELADARSQVEHLRVELEERSSAGSSAKGTAAQADLARQRAIVDGQRRELAQLVDDLHETQIALTATRSDIQHCSASLGLL